MWNNLVSIQGRLTKDPEMKTITGDTNVSNFTLAVKRLSNDKDAVDFIPCVAWNSHASYLCQFAHKGDKVSLEGSIHSRTYEKENQRHYVTEVLVNSLNVNAYRPVANVTDSLSEM